MVEEQKWLQTDGGPKHSLLVNKDTQFPKTGRKTQWERLRQEEGGRMKKGKKVGRGGKRRRKQGRGSEEEKGEEAA